MVSGYVEGDTHRPDHARRGGEECCRQTLLRAARHDARARLAEEQTGASRRAADDEVYPVDTAREASDPSSYPLRGPVPESNGLCTPSLLLTATCVYRICAAAHKSYTHVAVNNKLGVQSPLDSGTGPRKE